MTGCPPFTLTVYGDINQILPEVTQQARSKGFQFSGALPNGSFSGMGVHGTYKVIGNIVTINIVERGFAPCSMIESRIRGFFNG